MSSTDKVGFAFPGQGSQFVGMNADFALAHPVFAETLREANEILGMRLDTLMAEGPAAALDDTRNTQPALLTLSVALWRSYCHLGGATPACLVGHSLGEYSALVAAGALRFEQALKLVRARATFMQEAVAPGAGAMAAVLGLADEQVAEICAARSRTDAVVECANYNAPGQIVIAGHRAAVVSAAEALKAAGAKRVLPLAVSVPSHCSLMRPAAEQLAQELAGVEFSMPNIPVIHNVDAGSHRTPEALRQALVAQLHSPVRFTQCVRVMAEVHAVERVIECGPGKVLAGLIPRSLAGLRVANWPNAAALELSLATCAGRVEQRRAG